MNMKKPPYRGGQNAVFTEAALRRSVLGLNDPERAETCIGYEVTLNLQYLTSRSISDEVTAMDNLSFKAKASHRVDRPSVGDGREPDFQLQDPRQSWHFVVCPKDQGLLLAQTGSVYVTVT